MKRSWEGWSVENIRRWEVHSNGRVSKGMEWLTAKYSSVWVYWDMQYSVKLKIHRMRKGSKLANKNSLSFLNSQRCNHGAFLD